MHLGQICCLEVRQHQFVAAIGKDWIPKRDDAHIPLAMKLRDQAW
jgi:hypothetical protein